MSQKIKDLLTRVSHPQTFMALVGAIGLAATQFGYKIDTEWVNNTANIVYYILIALGVLNNPSIAGSYVPLITSGLTPLDELKIGQDEVVNSEVTKQNTTNTTSIAPDKIEPSIEIPNDQIESTITEIPNQDIKEETVTIPKVENTAVEPVEIPINDTTINTTEDSNVSGTSIVPEKNEIDLTIETKAATVSDSINEADVDKHIENAKVENLEIENYKPEIKE